MNSEMESDLFTTLDQAKAWLQVEAVDGAICPCCQRFDKVYRRKVSKSMVQRLCDLYRHPGWHEHLDFVQHPTLGRDYTLFRFIDLLEMAEPDSLAKKTSGTYRILEKGKLFCEGELPIPEALIIYHNELIGVSPETKMVHEIWPDFNYSELMGFSSNTEYLMK